MKETKRNRVCQVFVIVVAVSGFLIQSGDVLRVYFEYRTRSDVSILVPKRISAPDVSLCVRYVDVLKGNYNISSTNTSYEEDEKIRKIQTKITIREIFDNTPEASELSEKCLLRLPQDYRLYTFNASECNKRFSVTKFYTQEYICYRWAFILKNVEDRFRYFDDFTLKNETYFEYQNLAFTLSYPGLIYGIMMNYSSVYGADLCKVVLNNADSLPVNSIGYAPTFNRGVKLAPKYNLINVGYSITQLRRLPPPYNTDCRDYFDTQGEKKPCIDACLLKETLRVFDKVPFSFIKSNPENKKHISVDDLRNGTFSNLLTQMEMNCSSQCSQEQCLREFYSTTLFKEESGEFEYFQIMVSAPKSPIIKVITKPSWSIEEFLIYISTIFGIWFGVSVVSLNPLKLKKWLKKQNNKISVQRVKRGLKHDCPCKDCKNSFTPLLYQLEDIKKLLY